LPFKTFVWTEIRVGHYIFGIELGKISVALKMMKTGRVKMVAVVNGDV